jgi:hypothetical protein
MTTQSPAARELYIEGADAAVDALSAAAGAHRANGDMTRLSETETWLALAREDQAAAVAGVDAEQLAAMGPESVMTGPAPCCGYPGPEAPARVSAEDEGPWVTRLQAWERATVRPETTRREPEAGS